MAEAKQYVFSYKEIVEALIKKEGIHEGLWGVVMRFGIQGANIAGQEPNEPVLPVAIVPILEIGIQRVDTTEKAFPGVCDAAVVNPTKP